MLKRQESSLSASGGQETRHAKAIGCMSGVIRLFSKYQNSNRRLTFGKKQEKKKAAAATNSEGEVKVVRSPTLPPEIRRVEMARLMGVEEDSSKRQRLMEALEKCNQDLEELKRIIKAVQTANGGTKMCTDEKPADELTCSPLTTGEVQVPQHRKPTATKKAGEDEEAIAIARLVTKSTIIESSLEMRRRAAAAASSPPWSSRAMVESVEEVCNDIAWGEKREIGRIGLEVQDHVCRELIEELVRDLKSSSIIPPLPLEACKRKLCFS
ncbi:uncharacterized protein LOC121747118 isoform X2 [Salvia splendens]|uniref:uncharacterized protein LOC121747118 isoform X2 n=1 Tax=Salvia splendens TaxID=180675 RepID=UPI001C26F441|nr:uncharacterized protein LOC121747118 isoform X2 [Salvia splendens]